MASLYMIRSHGSYGFIDAQGRVVVEPTLRFARAFQEGLAVAQTAEGHGYIDTSGAFVIAPQHGHAESFVGGFAVAGRESRQGVIDRSGNWRVAGEWDRVDADGDFWRVRRDGLHGWCDASGRPCVAPAWREVSGSAATLLVVTDAQGPALLAPGSGELRRLSVAKARGPGVDSIPAEADGRWGILDVRGAWIVPPTWGWAGPFEGAHAAVRRGLGEFGLIDRRGQEVLAAEHRSVQRACAGWLVEDLEGATLLLDDRGVRVSGPWRAREHTGIDGVVLVHGERGWGAIRGDGRLCVEPTHDELCYGGAGAFAARRGEVWGALDPGNPSRWMIEPRFAGPPIFGGGGDLASIDEGAAYVDRAGREVWRRPGNRTPDLTGVVRRVADWDAVRATLPALATTVPDVFGARGPSGHGFRLGPRLGEAQLAALEARHRVTLPADFRRFLVEVGNGPVAGAREGGAGPGYGLYDVAAALVAAPHAHRPFEPGRSTAEWETRIDAADDYPHGLVTLGTHGCAHDYGLVVSGRFAGTLWTLLDAAWLPDTDAWAEILHAHNEDHAAAYEWCWQHLDELPIASFADVYMAWFEKARAALAAGSAAG